MRHLTSLSSRPAQSEPDGVLRSRRGLPPRPGARVCRTGKEREGPDQKAHFVVHAPRQSGKTTCFHHLARKLTAAGRYAAQLASCETARTVGDDVGRAVNLVVRAIEIEAGRDLPEELHPPPAESVHPIDAETRLNRYLGCGISLRSRTRSSQRPEAPPFAERGTRESRIVDGRKVLVLRL